MVRLVYREKEMMTLKKGTIYNSRSSSEWVLKMSQKDREHYIKSCICGRNSKLLIPFVSITPHDDKYRVIDYEINVSGACKIGTTRKSRKEGNFISRMREEERNEYIKDWVTRCNHRMLFPFIKIIKHDKYYREIEYVINIPNTEAK